MKWRLFAAVVCTAFSFTAIDVSWTTKSPLFIAAWVAYLLILVFWVRSNCAPKILLIAGTLLGVASVVGSYFVGLMWAFPAIALMLHVILCSFRTKAPNLAVKRDALQAARPLTDEQVNFFITLFKKVVETAEWRAYMEQGAYSQRFLTGQALKNCLTGMEEFHKQQLREYGFLPKEYVSRLGAPQSMHCM